jgi:hypothetical protein
VRGARVLGTAAALLAAAGCVRAPPPDLSRNPADLLEQVRRAQAGVTSCRGPGRLGISSPDLSGSLDAWVAAERPGRVRVEVFDFFGNPAAVLVAGGGRFALLDARAGAFYRGEDRPENLARLVPVPLGAKDLAAVLCGGVPILDGKPVSAEPGDGVVLLEIAGEAGRQVIAVGEEASIRSASFLPGPRGGTPWTVSFSVFRHPAGRRFPTEVELRGAGSEIQLRWKDDLEVNGPPDPGLFVLDPPRGARVVDLAPGAPPPPLELPLRPATPARP